MGQVLRRPRADYARGEYAGWPGVMSQGGICRTAEQGRRGNSVPRCAGAAGGYQAEAGTWPRRLSAPGAQELRSGAGRSPNDGGNALSPTFCRHGKRGMFLRPVSRARLNAEKARWQHLVIFNCDTDRYRRGKYRLNLENAHPHTPGWQLAGKPRCQRSSMTRGTRTASIACAN